MRYCLHIVVLRVAVLLGVLLSPYTLAASISALGQPMQPGAAKAGTLLVRADADAPLRAIPMLGTDVDISVTGLVARTVVTQYFHNPTDEWLEGIYVFPLPQNAAVDTLEVRIGDRTIVGEIKERAQAKKIYEQAKAQGKKAALLEQERPNIFTTSVAGIEPKGTVGVRIEYQRELDYRDGGFSLRFPMVVAPRYVPGTEAESFSGYGFAPDTDQVPDGSRISPWVADPARGSVNPVSLVVAINAGMAISVQSPSHAIDINEDERSGMVRIEPAHGTLPADRDFVLHWRPLVAHAPRAVLFTETFEEDQYALLMVMPPDAKAVQDQKLNREVIFVLDTSGSMAGASFRQARAALSTALKRLGPQDTFNVVAFASKAQRLYMDPKRATPANIAKALASIAALDATGGTEMLSALKLALRDYEQSTRVRQVVFITDGAVGNETTLFDYIGSHIGKSRLFIVGIGSSPNGYFMRKAARTGRGTYTYIGKPKEVREKMSALFARLESPVLTNIKLHWRQGVLETYPTPVPDLYAGEPLVVVVQAHHLGDEVRITGMRAGASWQQSVSLRNAVAKAGIARLYARRKIDSITLNTGDLRATLGRKAARDEVRNQIVDVGLRYHLVTRHTSLVAVERESSVPSGENLKAWPVPVNLPDGWEIEEIWLEKPAPALMKTASYMYEFDKKSVAENARIAFEKKIVKSVKKRRAEEKKAADKRSEKFTAAGQPGLQAALAARLPQTATPAQLLILLGMALLLAALLLRRWVLARC